ncbi:maleylacetate reductase [Bradyrhizobium iriomotense]|uniref:maleylacetate reductase n=1 Tax=Bradyrhizobium iriomotense TaxID=441950 RepID=UPI0024E15EE3|nr:maleylacetate reductase [Bradyrhizobium iriomotense]
MLRTFVYNQHPARVTFGRGSIARVGEEADKLGLKRVIVLSTPPQAAAAEQVSKQLADRRTHTFSGAVMHTPVEVTEAALTLVREHRADGLVAFGGGSTIGLSRALALRTDLPQIAIPTTYAGSEMTPILGEAAAGRKVTLRSPKVLPEVVIYDVDLTMSLPPSLSATSGINAIAHAVEALYAEDRNPVVDHLALDAIAAMSGALPRISADSLDQGARTEALYGAWLCGMCLGSVGMALHHKLCHALGGAFDLPHAETHTVILPHALAYNASAVPDVIARLKTVLAADNPSHALFELAGRVGAPRSLEALGMPIEGIEKATNLVLSSPYANPRQPERDSIRRLLHRAYSGLPPVSD